MRKIPIKIIIFIIILTSPYLAILNYNQYNSESPIPLNLLEKLNFKSKTFNEITKDYANGTRNGLNVTQTSYSNKTYLNWLVSNVINATGPESPAGDNERQFDVTVPTDYNRTNYEINIQNISAESTWRDVEQNFSTLKYILSSSSSPYAMSFILSRDSRITDISLYGYLILFSGYYDIEIWNSTGVGNAPQALLWNSSRTGQFGTTTWNVFSNINVNLTAGFYYFVINATNLVDSIPGTTGVHWFYNWDTTFNGGDNVDEGYLYQYVGVWSQINTQDMSLKLKTVYIDSSNNTLTNMNPEDIDMNMTIDSTVHDVNSTTYNFNFADNDGENKSITISTNSSFSCNLTWTSINVNLTQTTNIKHNISLGELWSYWKTNFSVSAPTASYGESLSNFSVTLSKPLSSWNMILALNSSDVNVTNGIIEQNNIVYLSNNTNDILTEGLWKFTFRSPTQTILISLNQSAVTSSYNSRAYIHGENIQINTSVSGFSNGIMNLSIYNTTNDDVTSDWTTINSSTLVDFVLFNVTVPASTETGNYTVQIIWTNESYSAINQTYLFVVNSTNLSFDDLGEVSGVHLIGVDLNVTVFYNDTHTNSPITEANLTIQIFNETDSSLVLQDNLTESLSSGYYNYTLSTNNFVNGSYKVVINASKAWYNNASINNTFSLIYNTSLIRLEPSTTITSNFEPFNLTIIVQYIDLKTGLNITNANVTYNSNMTGQDGNFLWHATNETYYIQLNYSDFTLDNIYEINITSSKLGYKSRSEIIYWNVSSDNTNPTVIIDSPVDKLNTSAASVQVNWTSSYDSESGIKVYEVIRNGSIQYTGTSTVQNINLVEGWNNITVVAQDYARNNGSFMIWVIMDSINPTITVTDPASNGSIDTGVIISISGFANGTGTEITSIQINNSNFNIFLDPSGSLSGNYEFRNSSYIADGYIAIKINITDSSGLTSSIIRWFYIDNTPPTISITDPASDGDIDTGAIISVSGNADGTGSNIVSVMINDSRFTIFTDPSGTPSGAYEFRNNTFIPDGNVAILVNVTDTAGLTTSATRWFDIDNTLPSLTITDPASNGDIDTGAIISISGNADGTGSNIVSVMINDSRFTIFTDPSGSPSGAYEFRNNTYIPDGNVAIQVNVTDQASLTTTASRWFDIDNTDPTITITDPASDGDIDTGVIISISGNADGTGSNILSVMINDSRFTIFTDPSGSPSGAYEFRNNTFIPDGNIAVLVNVTDSAGLTTSTTRWFDIDNTYPTITITDPASDGDIDTGTIISISGNADGTGSNIVSVMINDSRFTIFTDPSGSPSGAYEFRNNTFIPDGNIGVLVNVTDSAGLTTLTTRWFDIDNTYPTISITDPASDGDIDTGAIISISGNADGTGSNIVSVMINDSRFTIFTDPSGSPSGAYEFRNNTFIPDGNIGILVNVTDSASLTASTTRWFDIDNTYPTISITDPASDGDIDTGVIISISGNADGTGSNIVSVMINDSRFTIFTDPSGSPSGAYEFRNNTFIPDGNIGILVNVTDSASLTASTTRWFDIDNTYPTISITDPASDGDIDTGVIISISGNADGTGSNIVSVMINDSRFTIFTDPSGSPSGAYEFRNNTFIPDGNIAILVNVTDSASLTTSTTRWFDIDNTYPTISITDPASDGDIDTGTTISIGGNVDGTGSNIVSVMINDSRFTIFTDPSGTPSGAYEFRNNTFIPDGNVAILVNVTDSASLTTSATRWFDIDNTYPTITITDPASDGDIDTGTIISISGNADGTGSNIVSVLINDSRFTIFTDPSGSPSGAYEFRNNTFIPDGNIGILVNVTDSASLTTSTTRWFDIDNTDPTISITDPASDGDIDTGTIISIGGNVDGTGSNIVSVMINDSRFTIFIDPSGTPSGVYEFRNNTFIPDGNVAVLVNVTDSASLTTSTTRWFDIDNTYPTISITDPASDGDIDTGTIISISGNADGTGSNIASVMINDSRFTIFTDPSGTPSGAYEFRNNTFIPDGNIAILVNVTDSAGLTTSATRWFDIDNTNPTITITDPASDGDIDTGVIISISGNADGTGSNIVSVMINDSRFTIFTDPSGSPSGAYEFRNNTFIPDGNVAVLVNVTDSASLTTSTTRWFDIDNTYPTISITDPASDGDIDTGTIISISGNTDGTGSNIASVMINDSRFTIFTDPSGTPSGAYEFRNNTLILDGNIAILVNVTDSAGLTTSATRWFDIDNTNPTITITDPASDGDVDTGVIISISGNADGTGSNIVSVMINDSRFTIFTDPSGSPSGAYEFRNNTFIPDGNIGILVNVTDSASLTTSTTRWFDIDNTDPTISITDPASDGDIDTGTIISIGGNADGTGSNIASVMINESRFTIFTDPSGSPSGAYEFRNNTFIPDGNIAVLVNVTDSAGLTTSTTRWFDIDNIYPTISITDPTSDGDIDTGAIISISGNADGTGSNIVSVMINDSRFTIFTDPSGSPSGAYEFRNNTFIPDGNIGILVNVTDSAAQTTSTTRWFDIDNTDPTITITDPASDGDIDTGAIISISGNADGTGSNIVSVMINDSRFTIFTDPSGSPSGAYEFRNNTFISDGNIGVLVNITDSAGLITSTTRWFDVDNIYPTISIIDPTSDGDVDTGAIISISGNADGTGSNIVSVMINDSRFTIFTDPSGTPSGAYEFRNNTFIPDGNIAILVNVTDSASQTTSATRWFDIDNTYPTISITDPASDGDIDTGIIISVSGNADGTGTNIVSVMINDSRFTIFTDPSGTPSGAYEFRNNTFLADGNIGILVNITDSAGLTTSTTRWFDIDNTYPTISITDPTADGVTDTGTIISISGNVDGTGSNIISVMINDSRFTIFTDPSGTPSGAYEFRNNTFIADGNIGVLVNVTDSAGLTTSATRWFDIDNTYPTISITDPTSDGDIDTGVIISISGNADGTGSNIASVMINDSRFTIFTNPSGTPSGAYEFRNNTFLADGNIGVLVNVTDSAGLTTSTTRWFDIDNTYPTISIIDPASNGDIDTGAIISVSGNSDGTGSNIASVMINDSRFTIFTDPSGSPSGAYEFRNNTFIPDGNIGVLVNVTDSAGLTTSTTRWFDIDNTLPTISITDPASDGDIDTGVIISISGNADGTGSNIASVMINDSRFTIFTDPSGTPSGAYEFRNNTFIPDGNIGVLVNVTDSAGLTTSTTRWFDIDNTLPTISITDPASDGDIDTGVIISISGNADGTGSNIASVMINDSRFTIFTDPSGSPSGAYEFRNNTFIPDGNIGVLVNVTDSAGLTTSATRWFDIDNTLPTISITDPASDGDIDTGVIISISGNADGTGSNIVSVMINDSRFTIFTDPSGSPSGAYEFRNNSYIPDGNIGVLVNVTDSASLTASTTRWFDIDNTYPTISITDPASDGDIDTGAIISISGNADGTGSNIVSVMINDSRFTIFTDPSGTPSGAYEFRNNTFIPDGNIGVLVNVTDSAGLTTSTSRWFDIDNTYPTISIIDPASDGDIDTGNIISISGNADGTGSNIVSVLINDSRFTIFTDPSGTPSGAYEFRNNTYLADGNVGILVNVTDSAGLTTSNTRWFDIDNTYPTISITDPASDGDIDNGAIISVGGNADGTGSNIASVMINDTRFTIFTDPSGTPSGAYEFRNNTFIPDGNIGVLVNVTDSAGLTTSTTRWFDIDNTYPTITITDPASDGDIDTGAIIFISGNADGTGSNIISVMINDSRFTIFTDPSGSPSGAYEFRNNTFIPDGNVAVLVNVTDSASLTTSTTRWFDVDNTYPTISITDPVSDGDVDTGAIISISGNADGTGSNIVSVMINDSRFTILTDPSGSPSGAYEFRNNTYLADGNIGVLVNVTDTAGLTTSTTRWFDIDNTYPTISIADPASNGDLDTGAIIWINGTADGTGSDISSVMINDSRFTIFTDPSGSPSGNYAFNNNTLITDGTIAIEVNVTDSAYLTTSAIRWFILDNTNPTIVITHPFPNGTTDTGGSVTVDGWVDGTGTNIFSVQINDSRFTLTTNPVGSSSGPFTFSNNSFITLGNVAVKVNVTDSVGLTGSIARWFTYIIGPSVTVDHPSPDSAIDTGIDITINGTADGGGTNIDQVWINDSRFILTVNPSGSPSGVYGFQNISFIPDGRVAITITLNNSGGLSDYRIRWFIIDNTYPTISITDPTSDGDIDTGATISISGFVNGTGSNIQSVMINDSRFTIAVDPSGSASGIYTFNNNSYIPDGNIAVEVNITDTANLTVSTTRWFDIDNTYPTISITVPASNGDLVTGTDIWINGTVDGTGSNITSVMINDSRFTLIIDPSGSPSGNYAFNNNSYVADGIISIEVNITDSASLTSAAIRWLNLDNTNPSILINDPASNGDVDTGTIIWINGTVDGTGSNIVSVLINDSRFTIFTDPSGSPSGSFAFNNNSYITEGNIAIEVNVTDSASLTSSATRWFDVDNIYPTITINDPASDGDIDTGAIIWINGTVDGTGSNIISVLINDSRFTIFIDPSGSPSGSYAFNNNSYIPDGNIGIKVNITDSAGLTTPTTRWFDIDNTYPTITITDPASDGDVDTGAIISISGNADGTGSNIVSVMINDSRFTIFTDPSGTPSGAYEFRNNTFIPDGNIAIMVNVTDTASLTTSTTRWADIDNTYPTISITDPSSDGDIDTGAIISVSGNADGTGSNIASVMINDSRFTIFTDPSGTPSGAYEFRNNTFIPDGNIGILVNVTDSAGLTTSTTRWFDIDNTYPTISITDPASDGDIDTGTIISISGNADGTGSNIVSVMINDSRFTIFTDPSGSPSGAYEFRNNTFIPDGNIGILVNVTDSAGLTTSTTRWFDIDNTYPTISITDPASDGDIDTGTIISISGNADGTGSNIVSVMINDSRFTIFTDPSGSPSGAYEFRNNTFIPDGNIGILVNVTDSAGLTTSTTRWFDVDNTLPTITITDPASNGDIDTGAIISISGNADGTGSNIVSVMINDSRFTIFTDPSGSPSGAYEFRNNTFIPDGNIGILVNVTDSAGLTTSTTRWFDVDNTLPTITITDPASNGDIDTGAIISISGNADGTGSNIVSVMINDSRFTIFTDPSGSPSGAYEFRNNTFIPDGNIGILVNVTDSAGLTTSTTRWFDIDNTLPTITITDPVSDGDVDVGAIISVSGNADGTGSNIASVMINDSRFTIFTDPSGTPSGAYQFRNNTFIPDGNIGVLVNVTDSAGLTTSTTRWFDIDNTYPTISIIDPASDGDIDTGTIISISGNADGTGSNIASVMINDSRFTIFTDPSGTPSGAYEFRNNSFIPDGNIAILVNVTDSASLTTSAIRWFDIDNTYPTISITDPASDGAVDSGAIVSVSGNADGTGSNILSVMINDSRFTIFTDPSGTPSGAYEFRNNTFIPDGNIGVLVNVTDSAGLTTSTTRWFNIDNTYPTITITDPASNGDVDSGAIISISGNADGTGSNIISVMINDSRFTIFTDPSGSLSGPYEFRNNTYIPDGNVAIEVNVTNSAPLTISITRWFDIDNTYPTISITDPASDGVIDTGIIISVSGNANGTGSNIVSVMINDTRFTIFTDPSGTPSGAYEFRNNTFIPDGNIGVLVNVTDSAGLTVSTTRWFDIDNTYPTISITDPASDGDIDTGTIISISGNVNGTGTNIVSVMINDSRFTIFINPSGTPSGAYQFRNNTLIPDGNIAILVNVTDSAGLTTSTTRWFDIDNTNPTITITDPTSDGDIDTGAIISVSGNTDGTGSNIVSVMINDSRFTIFTDPSGTPSGAYEFRNNTFLADGNIGVLVNVTDTAGLTTSTTRWFDIDNTDPTISITDPTSDGDMDTGAIIWINGTTDGTGSNILSVMINDSRFTIFIDPSGSPSGSYAFNNNSYIPDGNIAVEVNVTDSANLTDFATRWFDIDNTYPMISIADPASDGDVDTGVDIWVNGTADGTGSNILSLMINDSRFTIVVDPTGSPSGNYAFNNNTYIPDGIISITVNVTDTASLTTSLSRWFNLDNTNPTIAITNPFPNGTTDSGSSVTIEGTVDGTGSNILSVQINDSRFILTTDPAGTASGPYIFTNNSFINLGTVSVEANVTDSANLTNSIIWWFTYIIGPSVTIDHPTANSDIDTGTNITINGTADGGGVNIDTIWINDSRFILTIDPSGTGFGNYGFENNSFIPDGIIAVNVTLNNTGGLIDSMVRWFIIDNTLPTISIINPAANGLVVTGNTILVSGWVDGTGSNIQSVMINDSRFNLVGDPTGSPSGFYTFTNNSYVSDGVISIEVNITDSANLTISTTRWFRVDNSPPNISITDPISNGQIDSGNTITITGFANGTASNIISVMINDSRFTLFINPAGSISGVFEFRNNTFVTDGLISVLVNVTDSIGLTTTNNRWFYIDNTAPTVIITDPASNGDFDTGNIISVSGNVDGTGSNITSVLINDSRFTIFTDPSGTPSGAYEFRNNTIIVDGIISILVNVTDSTGLNTLTTRWFYIDNINPTIQITTPMFNDTIQVGNNYQIEGFVNGTGSLISTVTINNTNFTLSVDPSGNNWGNFRFINSSYLPNGLIALRISVNDSVGLRKNLTITFTVLQNSNNTPQGLIAGQENIVYLTDSKGNIVCELRIFVSIDTNINMSYYTSNPTGTSLPDFLGIFGFTLQNPTALLNATMKLYYNESALNISETDLRIFYFNITKWIELNATLNTTGNYLEWFTTNLSYYAIAPITAAEGILFLPPLVGAGDNLILILIVFASIAVGLFAIILGIARRKPKKVVKRTPDVGRTVVPIHDVEDEVLKDFFKQEFTMLSKEEIIRIMNLDIPNESEKLDILEELAGLDPKKRKEILDTLEKIDDNF